MRNRQRELYLRELASLMEGAHLSLAYSESVQQYSLNGNNGQNSSRFIDTIPAPYSIKDIGPTLASQDLSALLH